MSYKKFQATQLFTGIEILGQDHVLVTDELGKVEEIVTIKDAGDDIQKFDGVLSPGFINCHCHLELSHMKGLVPEQTGLVDFVYKVVTQRHFPEEEIAGAISRAENEMLENGTIAVGDICNNLSTLPQKSKQRLAYYNFIEASGWLPSVAEMRFERSLEFYTAFEESRKSKVKSQNSIVPHAPYSVSEELWKLMATYFPGKTISIHNQETAFEDELFQTATGDFNRMYEMMKMDTSFFQPTGKSSLQSYFPKMKSAKNILLVHNTFTKEKDIAFAKRESSVTGQDVFYCLCVNANQYIEKALPPLDLLRKYNAAIVIGTDSLASNHSLNVLDELKTIARNFPSVPLDELLKWATSNGAKALQMNDMLGSFEKGKNPGILLLEQLDGQNICDRSLVKRLL